MSFFLQLHVLWIQWYWITKEIIHLSSFNMHYHYVTNVLSRVCRDNIAPLPHPQGGWKWLRGESGIMVSLTVASFPRWQHSNVRETRSVTVTLEITPFFLVSGENNWFFLAISNLRSSLAIVAYEWRCIYACTIRMGSRPHRHCFDCMIPFIFTGKLYIPVPLRSIIFGKKKKRRKMMCHVVDKSMFWMPAPTEFD